MEFLTTTQTIFYSPSVHPYFLIVMAAMCGGALGTERERKGHAEAGKRTLAIVGLGSSLFTILPMMNHVVADPWRMGAQVVTGIGFLGAGVLLKEGFTVKGLTTAALIWVTAAIGVCFASDEIMLGLFTTVFTLIITTFLKKSKDADTRSKITSINSHNQIEEE